MPSPIYDSHAKMEAKMKRLKMNYVHYEAVQLQTLLVAEAQ